MTAIVTRYCTSLTANEKFSYRVWAEKGPNSQNGIPTDGPLLDSTPYVGPTVEGEKGAATPVLITTEGFNKNPQGKTDPWLPANAKRPIGQLIGGGPRPSIATFIAGTATRERLTMTMQKLDGTVLQELEFKA